MCSGFGGGQAGQIGIGGILPYDNQEYLVRVLAPAKAADLAGLAVGPTMRLGELAKIEPRAILKRGSAGINGGSGVILSVYKAPGEDSRRMSRDISGALAEVSGNLPAGVVVERVFRQADFIQAAVKGVTSALEEGGVLVVLVVLAFLTSLWASAVTLTALPVSFLLAILLLWRLGFTLNTMTLGGLAIAVGQLVDDAVVDVENVWREVLRQDLARAARGQEPFSRSSRRPRSRCGDRSSMRPWWWCCRWCRWRVCRGWRAGSSARW